MTEREAQKRLWQRFTSHKYKFLNSYFFKEESDWLSFLSSGLCWEIEIKISRGDYKVDFHKRKHEKFDKIRNGSKIRMVANRFYFAVPKGLIDLKEIPDYAGLMYVSNHVEIIKKAPLLHKHKHDYKKLFNKLYYNYEEVTRQKLFST